MRPRGYRRLHVLLRREGHLINHTRLFRIYREEKLTVRRGGGRKRAMGTRAPGRPPLGGPGLMLVHDGCLRQGRCRG